MGKHTEKTTVQKIFDDEAASPKRGPFKRLRAYFLAGVLVTAPIGLTAYLTYVFFTFIDSSVAGLLPQDRYDTLYGHTTFPGLGLIAALTFFIVIGWFATNFFGRLFIRISEYFLDRMPVIRTLYGAIKQIFETIMASQSSAFREVVMLEYPRKGIWSIGFVTGRSQGEVQEKTDQTTVNVFLPTTPNPTSGYLLFVPEGDLKFLDMSVEEAVKLVVSAGIIAPPTAAEKAQKAQKTITKAKAKTRLKTKKTNKKPNPKK